jgi:hypothetical protein
LATLLFCTLLLYMPIKAKMCQLCIALRKQCNVQHEYSIPRYLRKHLITHGKKLL